ncbi:MAG: glycosyltransferase family 2 protein [Ginsengibacter sp.]
MLISGFSFVRNATKLYYPIKASIESILPIVDEFVIALGKGDADDQTLQEIQKIDSDKIKIIHTEWDLKKYPGGSEYAHQTDIAKDHCKGAWLFYLQSDEVVHEKFLPKIRRACSEFLNNQKVEGLLFDYKHFWGDYSHHIVSHTWYPKEIRIIRNDPDIHSWRDAQSFRCIPGFDGYSYFQKEGTFKLKVAQVDATVYHYGWVRPPELMQKKRESFETHMQGEENAPSSLTQESQLFNYGDLRKFNLFTEAHPEVMKDFIEKFNWEEQLNTGNKLTGNRKHDRLKYRLLTYIEQKILGGKQIGGFTNYKLIKNAKNLY